MEKLFINLIDLKGEPFKVELSPANRNVRVALNKNFINNQDEATKLYNAKEYKEAKKLMTSEGTKQELELKSLETGINVLSAKLQCSLEELEDKLLINNIKDVINQRQAILPEHHTLIKSEFNSEFWSFQDLGELNEKFNLFREQFKRRQPNY